VPKRIADANPSGARSPASRLAPLESLAGRPACRNVAVNQNIDWNRVRKQTLWSYEELIKKLRRVLAYPFVRQHYNHTMQQARAYAGKMRRGYLQNRGDKTVYIDQIIAHLRRLEALRVGTCADLIRQVATRERCLAFLRRTGFGFDHLIELLRYLLRWVLPFETSLRELIDPDDDVGAKRLAALRKQKIRSNLDLLEAGRTALGRARLARAPKIPPARLLALVHRADISRLAYVRGKTIKHLCGGGYESLEKIAGADLAEMELKMDAYYGTLGKSLADFKLVLPLTWMIGGAKTVPRVVKE
jgi:hypothetical protein